MEPNCSTIILSVEGLRASALGTYGQTSYETPGFDRLASEAITFDWCYADTNEPSVNLSKLAEKLDLLGVSPHRTVFASDDQAMLASDFLNRFQELIPLKNKAIDTAAESVGDTRLASSITEFGEKLAQLLEQSSENDSNCDAWLHLKGFNTSWDAPSEISQSLLDEEDAPINPCIEPAQLLTEQVNESEWCEARFHASCRYAAQVMVLDACLEGLMEFLDDIFESRNYQFILLGTSGYPLGEHGQIGGNDMRLYSEQHHVPVLWKTTDPRDRFSRSQRLTLLSDIFASTFEEENESERFLQLHSKDGNTSIRTCSWYLIQSGIDDPSIPELELYLKPDDLWEQNDVYKLEQATAEQLLALPTQDSLQEESN